MSQPRSGSQGGQVLVLFALALVAVVLGAGLVVDGGFAYAQRRATQNAADFAALAGTRIVGEAKTGYPVGAGTAAHVTDAINAALDANNARLGTARYVDASGRDLGPVLGSSSIPGGAFGVVVTAETDWRPFLLGVIGVDSWATSASATAFTPGTTVGGGVLPIGVKHEYFENLPRCPATDLINCVDNITSPGGVEPGRLNAGKANAPGQFAWLSFGLNGKDCPEAGDLGMNTNPEACAGSDSILEKMIRLEVDHDCCGPVGQDGSADMIWGNTGANPGQSLEPYILGKLPFWMPIWERCVGKDGTCNGANTWYHIVGFGAMVLTGESKDTGAKELQGVLVETSCANSSKIPNTQYCAAPGGSFDFDTTGEVRLVR